nr:hypothetical protein [Deltaproteobacteria bacterium]
MLDPDRIQAIAEDLGAVERRSVHHAGLAVCAWVLSAFERGTDTEVGISTPTGPTVNSAGARGSARPGAIFRPSSNPSFANCCPCATRRWLARAPAALRGRLAAFTDVLIPDGCAFKLANALSGVYKGHRHGGGVQLHAI